MKIKKGDNAKYIESIKLVDREFDAADIEFLTDPSTDGLPGYAAGPGMNAHDRSYYAQVRLKDFQQDKEAGVTFKLEIKVKKDIDLRGAQAAWGNAWFGLDPPESYWLPEDATTLVPGVDVIPKGTKITLESDRLWINNLVVDADADFAAGDRGLMVKPSKNDDNEITWENDWRHHRARHLFGRQRPRQILRQALHPLGFRDPGRPVRGYRRLRLCVFR